MRGKYRGRDKKIDKDIKIEGEEGGRETQGEERKGEKRKLKIGRGMEGLGLGLDARNCCCNCKVYCLET
jgi:hypothetical protein